MISVKKVLISEKEIKQKVKTIADEISKDYAGKDLTIVSVLKGSVVFFADLIRSLSIDFSTEFVSVSSYEGKESTEKIKLLSDLKDNWEGKNILLVEDIIDSGYTLEFLHKVFNKKNISAIKTCVLLDKADARKVDVTVDYRGFKIPDSFVVGYGLDYDGKYRGLPYISTINTN